MNFCVLYQITLHVNVFAYCTAMNTNITPSMDPLSPTLSIPFTLSNFCFLSLTHASFISLLPFFPLSLTLALSPHSHPLLPFSPLYPLYLNLSVFLTVPFPLALPRYVSPQWSGRQAGREGAVCLWSRRGTLYCLMVRGSIGFLKHYSTNHTSANWNTKVPPDCSILVIQQPSQIMWSEEWMWRRIIRLSCIILTSYCSYT